MLQKTQNKIMEILSEREALCHTNKWEELEAFPETTYKLRPLSGKTSL
jgi:hypothetical protein